MKKETNTNIENTENVMNEANKMGSAPIGKLLASMAWPAILSMTINALYNVVDSMFVAMVSQKALTAVSLVMPLQMMMISLAVGSSVGVNSLISRRLGAKRYEEANKAASTSIRIGFFNFVIFALIGIFLANPFMHAYTDDAVIFDGGVTYLRIITIFCLFSMVQIQLEKVLQATGNMIAPMIISLSGALTNLILDPILIFGLIGAPKMGIAGAAAATVIGQAVGMCVAIFMFFRKEHDVKIQLKGFRIDWKVVKDIYGVGLPSIIMQAIGSVMLLGYNAILAASATAVAVLGVYYKLQSFIFMPVFGLNQGAMPIMGYNFGAKNRARLMLTYKDALITALVIMGIGTVLFQVFPDVFLKMFSADDEMMEMGVPALRIISICFIPAAFGIMTFTLFQGTGHGVYSLMGSLLRQLIGILPLAYIIYHAAGITASWASFPLAEIIGLIYSAVMLKILYKKEIKTL
ncbi:MATE family efflux transporter [Ihubacter sp. mB4P-1]|uniref:MATE family efflux transporter n=1 Tax=Ihubacter sp. mB4P-1 TaxID=3242370 RepID=UPI003C7DD01E